MKIFSTFFILLFCYFNAAAQIVPEYEPSHTMTQQQLDAYRKSIWDTLPAAIGWVNDFEGLFTMQEEDSMERKITHFEKLTGVEIAIVTVDSNMVARDKFDEFAYRLLKLWGIGKLTESNGIVICISRDYKKIFISTDFGIDQYIDQYDKYKLINKYIIPQFKKNDYYAGTLNGLDVILDRISKKWYKDHKG